MFYEKTMSNLCSEQRIIYAEKRVNNFLNNADQKIILCVFTWQVLTLGAIWFFCERVVGLCGLDESVYIEFIKFCYK